MNISFGVKSDKGSLRKYNEDAYATGEGLWTADTGYLFAVCDGIGGGKDGGTASRFAADAFIKNYYTKTNFENPEQLLEEVKQETSQSLWEFAQQDDDLFSWVSAASLFLLRENKFYILDIPKRFPFGDPISYAFKYRAGKLSAMMKHLMLVDRLIKEGILPEEAATSPPFIDGYIRSFGESLESDHDFGVFQQGETKIGDQFLICTEGLANVLSLEEMTTIFQQARPPQETAELLVARAYEQSHANLTALVVSVDVRDSKAL